MDCLGDVAYAVFSNIFGGDDDSSSDSDNDYRRMIGSSEEINHTDFKIMIDKVLTKVYQGETINIDPEIRKMVHTAVNHLPDGVKTNLETQFQENQNQSQEYESEIEEGQTLSRRTFG